mgnify:CR=1 FL=1
MALLLAVAVVKVGHAVMQCRCREQSGVAHFEAEAGVVGLLPPAYVALCTCLLRSDVGIELLVGGLRVQPYALRQLAVSRYLML